MLMFNARSSVAIMKRSLIGANHKTGISSCGLIYPAGTFDEKNPGKVNVTTTSFMMAVVLNFIPMSARGWPELFVNVGLPANVVALISLSSIFFVKLILGG